MSIFEQAKKIIRENENVFFVSDLIAFLPICRSAFYEKFPIGSFEMEEIKKMLMGNRTKVKTRLENLMNIDEH